MPVRHLSFHVLPLSLTGLPPACYCLPTRALGSAGQSAWFTPRMSGVQIPQRPYKKRRPMGGVFSYRKGAEGFEPRERAAKAAKRRQDGADSDRGGLKQRDRKSRCVSKIPQRPYKKRRPMGGVFLYRKGAEGFEPRERTAKAAKRRQDGADSDRGGLKQREGARMAPTATKGARRFSCRTGDRMVVRPRRRLPRDPDAGRLCGP